jgi:hypothetical protein
VEILALIVDVERRIGDGVAAPDEIVHARRLGPLGQRFRLQQLARTRLLSTSAFQQRVLFHFLGDEPLDLEVGQCKQANGLLQLRRHHQRLRLPKVEARREAHIR